MVGKRCVNGHKRELPDCSGSFTLFEFHLHTRVLLSLAIIKEMAYDYILTKHALQRAKERKIPQSYLEKALQSPERTIQKDTGTIELQKRIDGRIIAAIIKENDRGEKIVVSCWVNPPFPGTKDAKKRSRYFEMQKASPWKKIWLTILNQLGL